MSSAPPDDNAPKEKVKAVLKGKTGNVHVSGSKRKTTEPDTSFRPHPATMAGDPAAQAGEPNALAGNHVIDEKQLNLSLLAHPKFDISRYDLVLVPFDDNGIHEHLKDLGIPSSHKFSDLKRLFADESIHMVAAGEETDLILYHYKQVSGLGPIGADSIRPIVMEQKRAIQSRTLNILDLSLWRNSPAGKSSDAFAVIYDQFFTMAEALPGEVDKLNYTLFMTEGLNSEEVDQFTEMMQENAPTFGFKQVGITVVGDLNFKKSSETFRTRSHLESDQPSPNDYLGFQSVADSVAAFVQHKSTRLPLCIAIDGPWGSGKSSMMLMIQEALQKGSTKAREKLKTAPGVFGSLRQSLWLSYLILEPLVFIGAIAFIRWWYRTNPDATGPSIGGVAAILLGTYLYVAVGAFMLRWYRRRRRHNNPQRQFETVTINAWRYGEGVRLKASIVQSIITELLDRRGARFFLKLRLLRLNRITLLTSLSKGLFQSWFFAAVAIAVGLGLILYDAQGGSRDFLETFATSLGLNLSAENGNSILGALVAGLGILGQLTKNGNVANVSDFIANPDYEGLMGPDEEIEEDFRRILQLLDDEGYTLAIFIDDLDRCSPTAVHKVVEALNVFFGQPDCRCLFVLGMHKEMVATSLEVAYSAIADKMAGNCLLEEQRPFGRRFLEKIVQFVLHVPKPREEQVEKYLQHMTSGMTDADFRALAKQEAVEKKATVDRFALRLEHVWSYYVYLWHRVKGLLGMGKPIDPAPPPQPVAARLAMIESNESAKARLDEERERIARFEARLEAAANFTEGSDENIRMFSMVRPALGSNPRQYKRYFNQLRFNRFITEDRQPESEEKSLYTDAVMAAIALECPEAYQWAYSTLTIEGKERNIDAALRCLKNKVAEDLPDTITTLDDAVTIEQRVHLLLRTNPAFLSLLQTPEATAKKA